MQQQLQVTHLLSDIWKTKAWSLYQEDPLPALSRWGAGGRWQGLPKRAQMHQHPRHRAACDTS